MAKLTKIGLLAVLLAIVGPTTSGNAQTATDQTTTTTTDDGGFDDWGLLGLLGLAGLMGRKGRDRDVVDTRRV
jgi:hypothetical protein